MFRKELAFTVVVLFVGSCIIIPPNIFVKTAKADLPTGLVGFWKFDEGTGNITYDSSGNNNHGNIHSPVWTGGINGTTLAYDGFNDYVEVDDDASLNFGANDFSLEAWFNTGNSKVQNIIYKRDYIIGNKGQGYALLLDGGTPGFFIRDGNEYDLYGRTTGLDDYKWHHIVGLKYGNTSYLYIDGVQDENTLNVSGAGSTNNTHNLYFGVWEAHFDYFNYFDGLIDEIRIYNRALTAEEIVEHYEEYFPIKIVYVDDDFNSSTPGWGYDHFDKIQDGIDAVVENGTVYVYNGTYHENIIVNKTIDLIGENKNTTVIDGNWNAGVVTITVDNVNISGFMIQHGGTYWSLYERDAGIEVYANDVQIFGNKISYNGLYGIWLYNATHVNILDNQMLNNSDACILFDFCSNITINHNHIAFNSWAGICIGNHDDNNTISYNLIENTSLWQGSEGGWGIAIANHEGNILNSIYGNTIANNSAEGIICEFSNNKFYHNNLINNHPNAYDNGSNIWDNGYPSGGNYWDDYFGVDNYHGPNQNIPGPDGIGDTPYDLPCEYAIDWYPLMFPFEKYFILQIFLPNIPIFEGNDFPVLVYSLANLPIQDAVVDFNDELKLTDSNGTVWFTAPQVENDTYYEIKATKTGFIEANRSIRIRDVLSEFNNAFIFGRITNLTTVEDTIMFEAVNIKVITFKPFSFNPYKSGEQFFISKDYKGLLGYHYIFAFCKM